MNPLRLVVAIVALIAVLVVFAFAYAYLNSSALPSNTLVLNASSSGHTFSVGATQTVQVQLQDAWPVPGSSLVWRVSASDNNVLTSLSGPTATPHIGGRVPVTFSFRAHASGLSILNAVGATTCEAIAKTNCPDRQLSFTILVHPKFG